MLPYIAYMDPMGYELILSWHLLCFPAFLEIFPVNSRKNMKKRREMGPWTKIWKVPHVKINHKDIKMLKRQLTLRLSCVNLMWVFTPKRNLQRMQKYQHFEVKHSFFWHWISKYIQISELLTCYFDLFIKYSCSVQQQWIS